MIYKQTLTLTCLCDNNFEKAVIFKRPFDEDLIIIKRKEYEGSYLPNANFRYDNGKEEEGKNGRYFFEERIEANEHARGQYNLPSGKNDM